MAEKNTVDLATVPGPMPRGEWEEDFFKAYELYGIASWAEDEAGVPRGSAVRRRKSDPEFGQRMVIAHERAMDRVRVEIADRALNGSIRPVYQLGRLAGYETVYDNKLLMWYAERILKEEFYLGPTGDAPVTVTKFVFNLGETAGEREEIEAAEVSELDDPEGPLSLDPAKNV